MQDLVIENAMIHDGTGKAPTRGSVAVKDGRIAAVSANVGAGKQVIDADGFALMPGIIDTHTHYDAQITWDPFVNPSPALGVTTVIMGNCGFTIAPCRPSDRDLVMRNLTHVEGMSLDSLRSGIDWSFESFPEYLDALERRGVGPNTACFVGHSSIRTFVMREDATKRAATAEEVEQMRRLVVEGMRAGACGFSTTRNGQHNGEAGIPMPSRLADEREMLALSSALADAGRGVLMMTKDALPRRSRSSSGWRGARDGPTWWPRCFTATSPRRPRSTISRRSRLRADAGIVCSVPCRRARLPSSSRCMSRTYSRA